MLRSARELNTRRLQLIAIGAMLLVALIAAAVSLGQAKPRITGNNGVSPDVFLTTTTSATGPLCTKGVTTPAGTAGVRLYVGTYATPGVQMTLTTRDKSGRVLGTDTPAAFDDGAHVIFKLPAGARENLTLCWSTGRKVAVAGEPNGNVNLDQVSTLGKKPVPGDISVEYMRAGEHSALSMVPTIFERASLFRPSWVGPWTYYVLFIVALLSLLAAILVLLGAGRDDYVLTTRKIVAVAAIAFVNAGMWALITPAFNSPDELAHFSYVETVAGGHLPQKTLKSAKDPGNSYLPSTVYAGDVTALKIVQHPSVKEPWNKSDEVVFEKNYDQIESGPDKPYGLTPAKAYTPIYYVPGAIAYKLGGVGNIFDRLFFVRLWSGLLFALAAAFVMLFVREMLPRFSWAPPVAGLAVAFEPMAAHIGGGVSNDSLLLAACAAALWLGARVLRRGISFWPVFALTLTVVAAYAAKPTSIGIWPAIAFAVLVAVWRSKERWPALRTALLASVVPAMVLLLIYKVFGGGGGVAVADHSQAALRPATPTGFLSYLWQWYLPSVGSMDEYWLGVPPAFRVWFEGFFANFNGLDTKFGDSFYEVLAVAGAGLFVLVLKAVWDRRPRLKTEWPIVVYPALAVLGTAMLVHVTGYLLWVQDGQVFAQGRYLFPAMAVFALYVVTSGIGAGKRWQLPLASAVVVAIACINIAGMMLSLGRFYL